jgi:acylphosphatase
MKATRLLVRGIVQGVCYRLYTARVARTLRLNGFVRNLDDGRVEAVVAGPGEIIERFVADLRKGPPGGRVDGIETSEVEFDDGGRRGFEIRT